MAISAPARRNSEELFPGHVSTLPVTDPELGEVFGIFAFDEVLQHGVLLFARGVELPLPGQAASTPADRLTKGLATQQEVVGAEAVDAMQAAAAADEQP